LPQLPWASLASLAHLPHLNEDEAPVETDKLKSFH